MNTRRVRIGIALISCGVFALAIGFHLLTLPTHPSCTYWSDFLYGRPCGHSWMKYEANATVYLLGLEFPLQIHYDFGTPAIMIAVFWALVFSGMALTTSGTASSTQNPPPEREKV